MFCINCGSELPDNAKFCLQCGTKVGVTKNDGSEGEKRKQVFEGEIKKCPNCGEVLESFQTKCNACGYELRDIKSSKAVTEFSKKLEDIDNELEKENSKSFMSLIGGNYFNGIMKRVDKAKKRANLISSFIIPNSKEEIFEFIILSSTNIQKKYFKKLGVFGSGEDITEFNANKAVMEAWVSKMKQAYEKAKLSFGRDKDFDRIEQIFNNKLADII